MALKGYRVIELAGLVSNLEFGKLVCFFFWLLF
jgi:hypothetical protein